MTDAQRPLVVTGQQIGAGWTPALSVVKALCALAWARRLGGEALYWMADEDHDHAEVSQSVALDGDRLRRVRAPLSAPAGTATGWLAWGERQQQWAEGAWGSLPEPVEPTLRGHVLALGEPLWRRGLRPFSPTDPAVREPIQETLLAWRELGLEADLVRQAEALEAAGTPSPLDPRVQAAWFSLDPRTGRRQRLDAGDACPDGHWLSPGAALRPLMQSLLLPVTHVVLGPAERAYWRLAEPLWERVGLQAPVQIPRPSVMRMPEGWRWVPDDLEALRAGDWAALAPALAWPSAQPLPAPDASWPKAVQERFRAEMGRTHLRLGALDRRLARVVVGERMGGDPERLRQALFPLGRVQERVLPGLYWLRDEAFLDQMLAGLAEGRDLRL